MIWRPAGKDSSKRLKQWLIRDEWKHVALTSRLRDAGGVARFGQIGEGRLWIRENRTDIGGAIFMSRNGVVLPAYERDDTYPDNSEFIRKLLSSRRDRLFSIIGMENRVLDMEGQMPETAPDVENYRMLTGEGPIPPGIDEPPGLKILQASISDLDRLWNLEKGYQIEEVLRKGNHIDERSGRRYFLKTLENQIVYYALLGDRPVAKAGTNARGWTYDQIGGVFVNPGLRGYGFASAVMRRLLSEISSSGRHPCLFVKDTNLPALKLYEKLGFQDRGAFRISYWSK